MTASLCIFGEVLFDHFPDGQRVLGGAPFNVAWNLQGLGEDVRFISRVGDDDEGKNIREAMRDHGMDDSSLQQDERLPTGRVSVSFSGGEPSYDIVAPCAYDRVQLGEPVSAGCDVLYHGTLGVRDPVSREALLALQAAGPRTIFLDVNLRPPWWEKAEVLAWVERANWVKLNGDELEQLSATGRQDARSAQDFLQQYALDGLLLTRGSAGAELFTGGNQHYVVVPEADIAVVDTVGAGDAFAAVVLLGLVRDWPLQQTLQRAQAFASAQVGQRGATVADPAHYRKFIDDWHQA
jgi:fructokinase